MMESYSSQGIIALRAANSSLYFEISQSKSDRRSPKSHCHLPLWKEPSSPTLEFLFSDKAKILGYLKWRVIASSHGSCQKRILLPWPTTQQHPSLKTFENIESPRITFSMSRIKVEDWLIFVTAKWRRSCCSSHLYLAQITFLQRALLLVPNLHPYLRSITWFFHPKNPTSKPPTATLLHTCSHQLSPEGTISLIFPFIPPHL